MEKKYRPRDAWYKLDNAANIFPAVSGGRNTNVFRLSCELRENIDKVTLQLALDAAMKGYGHFQVVMRRGLFWFYLEQTSLEPKVSFENDRPCARIFYKQVKGLLFNVTYYRRRINLEVFHAISDGNGAFGLLHAIVQNYIMIKHGCEISAPVSPGDGPPPVLGSEDSFAHHYDPGGRHNDKAARAYQIAGTMLPANSIDVICGTVSTNRMLALAKSKGATVTAYMTSLLICSIYSELMPKHAARRPIGVIVPVDLRGHFTSETTRNFFGVVEIRYQFDGSPADFDAVLASVSSQFAEKVRPEALLKRISYTTGMQRNLLARFTPLILKNRVLNAAYKRSERSATTALSNLGRISVPEAFEPYITGFGCLLNPTPIHRVKVCVCSYNDDFVISFTSCIAETKAQKYFFRHLSQNGLDVVITCNGVSNNEVL